MILNVEELKQAVVKILESGETIQFQMEATFHKESGSDEEGLLIVMPNRLAFVSRPAFGEPQIKIFGRAALTIVGKQEDLFGATLKAKTADESFELRRINPSDFKRLWAELSGEAAPVTPEAPEPLIQDARQAILETMSMQPEQPITMAPPIITQTPISAPPMPETPPSIAVEGDCYIHSGTAATAKCDSCGKPICQQCAIPMRFKTYCPNCLDEAKKYIREQRREAKATPPPLSPERREKIAAAMAAGVVGARSPTLAFLFSFMPGFGQFYNKQYVKGFIVLLTSPIGITWLWGFSDAVSEAKKYNARIGIKAQSAGFLAFLFILFLIIFNLMLIGIVSGKKNDASSGQSYPSVPAQTLQAKRDKVQKLLTKDFTLQKQYLEKNKKFMDTIPDEIAKDNDTGYRLELIMLGKDNRDFRLYAWAATGNDKKLDLWSVGSDGFVAHEYAPDLQQ